MRTYNDYVHMQKALTFEEMRQVHQNMLAAIGTDENAIELYHQLLTKAVKYTEIRASWSMLDREEKASSDARRTSAHDTVILHFDVLARYLGSKGRNTGWRDVLGYEKDDGYNRKRIGDMANYLVFVEAVNNR